MKNDSAAPADTRMMNIVHQALRRDLDRATTALDAIPPPADRQREAIAEHLAWMMDFLRAHHESEDDGLYPIVRERRPDAAAVLDEMDRDHQHIAAGIDAVEAAASAYGRSDDPATRTELLATIRHLDEILLPHLKREEDEAMPMVSAGADRGRMAGHRARAQREAEGHGSARPRRPLVDRRRQPRRSRQGARARAGRAPLRAPPRLRAVLPPPARCVLAARRRVNAVSRSTATTRSSWPRVPMRCGTSSWTSPASASGATNALSARSSAAPPAPNPVPGSGAATARASSGGGGCARSWPPNRRELVWRTVPTTFYPDSTVWRIRVTPTNGGTRLEQSFEVVRAPKVLDVIYATILPAHRDRAAALTDDLRRLGALASSPKGDRSNATS